MPRAVCSQPQQLPLLEQSHSSPSPSPCLAGAGATCCPCGAQGEEHNDIRGQRGHGRGRALGRVHPFRAGVMGLRGDAEGPRRGCEASAPSVPVCWSAINSPGPGPGGWGRGETAAPSAVISAF